MFSLIDVCKYKCKRPLIGQICNYLPKLDQTFLNKAIDIGTFPISMIKLNSIFINAMKLFNLNYQIN